MTMKNKINYDVFIKGDLVNLVVLTEEIVKKTNWYKWFNDEESTKNMQKHYFPNTVAIQLNYFNEHILNNKTKLQLGVVEKKNKHLLWSCVFVKC